MSVSTNDVDYKVNANILSAVERNIAQEASLKITRIQ